MPAFFDLATLVGHLEPFKHLASAIVYETDSTGSTTSVQEAIFNLEVINGMTNGFPSVAAVICELGLVVGQFVYIDAFGVLQGGLADDISTSKVIGVVWDTDDSGGADCEIKATGPVIAYTGLVTGERYFLSETVPGGISSTVPTTPGHVIKFVGTALTSTSLFVDTSQPLTIRT